MTSQAEYVLRIEKLKASIDQVVVEKSIDGMQDVLEYYRSMAESVGALRVPLGEMRARLKSWQVSANEAIGSLERRKGALVERDQANWNPEGPPATAAATLKAASVREDGRVVLHEGYLWRKRLRGIGSPWKRVWVTLWVKGRRGTTGQGRAGPSPSSPQASISWAASSSAGSQKRSSMVSVVEDGDTLPTEHLEARQCESHDRRWCFELVAAGGGPGSLLAVLQAENEDEMQAWLRAIQNSCAPVGELLVREDAETAGPVPDSQQPPLPKTPTTPTIPQNLPQEIVQADADLRSSIPSLELVPGEIGVEVFSAALSPGGILLGRVLVSSECVRATSTVFGVESRASVPLSAIKRMQVETGEGSFWLTCTLSTRDPNDTEEARDTELTFRMLDEEASRASIDRLERVIDFRRSVRERPLAELLQCLYSGTPGKQPKPTSTSKAEASLEEVQCGCTEHCDRMVYSGILGMDLEGILERVFGSDLSLVLDFLQRHDYRDPEISEWKPSPNNPPTDATIFATGSTRTARFSVPNPLLKNSCTPGIETWTMRVYERGRRAIIDKRADMPEVLYGDCFCVNVRYCLTALTLRNDKDGAEELGKPAARSTRMKVSAGMTWFKSPLMKPIIASTTARITDASCRTMITLIEEMVRKEAKGGDLVGKSDASAIIENEGIPSEEPKKMTKITSIKRLYAQAFACIYGILLLVALIMWLKRPVIRCVLHGKLDASAPLQVNLTRKDLGVFRAEILDLLEQVEELDRELQENVK